MCMIQGCAEPAHPDSGNFCLLHEDQWGWFHFWGFPEVPYKSQEEQNRLDSKQINSEGDR